MVSGKGDSERVERLGVSQRLFGQCQDRKTRPHRIERPRRTGIRTLTDARKAAEHQKPPKEPLLGELWELFGNLERSTEVVSVV